MVLPSCIVGRAGQPWSRRLRPGPRPAPGSEVELVDIALVEDERRAEQDRMICPDRELAELPGRERLAGRVGDLPRREIHRGVGGEVTEVGRVPQLERLHRPVRDVFLHRVRGTGAGVPRPVTSTWPRREEALTTCAAARIPTVVGEMMPLRFG